MAAYGLKIRETIGACIYPHSYFIFLGIDSLELTKRMNQTSQKALWQLDRCVSLASKTPVDAYPGDLLFFLRVTEVMQGLGMMLRPSRYCLIKGKLSRIVSQGEIAGCNTR